MSAAFATQSRTAPAARGSVSVDLAPVSQVQAASNRVTVRILIANQQPIVRYGLRALLADQPDLTWSARPAMAATRSRWPGDSTGRRADGRRNASARRHHRHPDDSG